MKTKMELLDYQLMDVLEMQFSQKPEVLEQIKTALLSRPIKDFNLYLLSSFALEDALVVIGAGSFKRMKRLYLLNARSESLKMCCIHSMDLERGISNGRESIDSFQCQRLAPA